MTRYEDEDGQEDDTSTREVGGCGFGKFDEGGSNDHGLQHEGSVFAKRHLSKSKAR